ncbi:MAG: MdtA/MuxA family multidrug efflux RND transporter periplasmic adaptor subunit [Desulfovibrionaceae bacterium]|nr:MdtA/MuxA family multidrug efflux RND transporter periplasmic adaptor subunit [Desulfovibrionaceae bacterium]
MPAKTSFIWKIFWLALIVVGCLIIYKMFVTPEMRPSKMKAPLAPVRTAEALIQDVPYFLNGLGTVLASSDVLVKSRVNGQLMRIHFKEGQRVKTGELLAEIDPRPFQAALNEARGKLAADEAQLNNAKRDLERYSNLIQGEYVERQKYDTQRALVAQYQGAVAADKAAVENARLQLEYSRITAPASGIVGLRKVDVGNQISSSDANGIVRITEMSPCEVLFSLPETSLPQFLKAFREVGRLAALPVQAWDREQKNILAIGHLQSLDNEIDRETGTVRLKASFANKEKALYPNQFVNARIRVTVLREVVTVPTAAVQVGPRGNYVYVFKEDKLEGEASLKPKKEMLTGPKGKVELREVEVGLETARLAVIKSGLAAKEMVVVDGLDRLKHGSEVQVAASMATPKAEPLQ